jgi:hypothetical protein
MFFASASSKGVSKWMKGETRTLVASAIFWFSERKKKDVPTYLRRKVRRNRKSGREGYSLIPLL